MCFYRRSVNFYDSLQRASPSLLVLLDRPHLPRPIHMPNFLSRFIQHHRRFRRCLFRRPGPRHHPNVQWSLTHVSGGHRAGGLSFGFLGADSRFQRLENDMRDFKQAMFGASFGSATLLSCPIAVSGCTEDHKSNIRTSIMLENNASTMYFLGVLLTGTFNAG